MNRYTVAILVRNQFGVLNRVTSMFRRRQFNIVSLTVSETEDEGFSRITAVFEGVDNTKRQLITQLYKLPDVAAVSELDREGSIHCELLLIKLVNVPERRGAILEASDAFGAKVMEFSREAIILQLVGESIIVDSFVDLLRDYDILEIARTGVVSLERGSTTMRSITRL